MWVINAVEVATENKIQCHLQQIWDIKYRLKEADGTPIDRTVKDSWRRIASDLARVEKDPAQWEEKFYHALEDFKFLPAGRITAGAGTARKVTLFNCFIRNWPSENCLVIHDVMPHKS